MPRTPDSDGAGDIENTATKPRNPFEDLPVFAGRAASRRIEQMEKDGQRQLVTSSYLPAKGTIRRWNGEPSGLHPQHMWERMGIVFGEVKQGDPLFVQVVLPDGWKLQATDHDMWSDLVDASGAKRAAIFYKAAFYDREAFIRPNRRYEVRQEYRDGITWIKWVVLDTKTGTNVFEREWFHDEFPGHEASKEVKDAYYAARDAEAVAATDWIKEHYPQWEDPLAYWD